MSTNHFHNFKTLRDHLRGVAKIERMKFYERLRAGIPYLFFATAVDAVSQAAPF